MPEERQRRLQLRTSRPAFALRGVTLAVEVQEPRLSVRIGQRPRERQAFPQRLCGLLPVALPQPHQRLGPQRVHQRRRQGPRPTHGLPRHLHCGRHVAHLKMGPGQMRKQPRDVQLLQAGTVEERHQPGPCGRRAPFPQIMLGQQPLHDPPQVEIARAK